tara:strand:- start:1114 stop:1746 length:633 start_codon:yes stop_codon:yes gene_type:complete
MHNETYNINVACFCNENFTKSLEEIKSFFGFNLISKNINNKDLIDGKFNAIIVELENEKKILLQDIMIPKILIQKNNKINKFKDDFSLIVKLPLNVVQFNQDIIDICKKHEFKKNSLIKIKNYILDKNSRVLKKNDTILKVTEKEVIFLEMLYFSNKPLSRDYILKNIWKYSSETETHTIETHIYRLRQKIKSHFNDNDFIKNSKEGYSL